ncbi:UDP-galactose transporter [Aureobasidium pullulans]|nr:UDP-galactose transporter [Aureobasidium pullulans]THY10947.1 UDP-galactose transporter [Aureobasidium pullulans]
MSANQAYAKVPGDDEEKYNNVAEASNTVPEDSATTKPSVTNSPMIAILSYCGSSILMTVTNKYVLGGRDFNLNFFLLCVQSVICLVTIESCKRGGLITYREFNMAQAKKWFPISALLVGMIYTGSKALAYLTIPVYTIFKNLTIICIAYGEVLCFGGSVTRMALVSFGLMVLSSGIAAWADVKTPATPGDAANDGGLFSMLNAGYVWMALNCICNAVFVLAMKVRIKVTNFKDFDTMYYNNLLSIPILLVCSLLLEDWSSANVALNFPADNRTSIISAMVISGLSSVFISYTSAWCVRVTSSTTYSMVGALNKLPLAISGLLFFNNPVTLGGCSAIALGFVSGLVYTYAKINEKKTKEVEVLPMTKMPTSRDT